MSKTKRTGLLLLILGLGFALRLTGLVWGQAYRAGNLFDELAAYEHTLKFLAGDEQAQYIGQPHFAGGNVPGPLWAILWSVPFRIDGTNGVVVAMILLNTAVIYLLGLAMFDERVALWAALICATAPWAVYESVGKCNPLVMAFFGALLYLALWQVVRQPRSPYIFWVCVVLTMMPQFHMFTVFLVPGVLLLLWLRRREIHWPWLAAGLAVSLLLYVPYLWGDAHHGWQNTRAMAMGNMPKTPAALKVFTLPIVAMSSLIAAVTGNAEYAAFGKSVFGSVAVLIAFNIISLAVAALSIFNFVAIGTRKLRPLRPETPEIFLSVLLLGPLLAFLLTLHNFASRYTIALVPVLFLLPAKYLMEFPGPQRWLAIARAAMVLTIAFDIVLMPMFFHYQGNRIDNGSYFIASFQKLEQVRTALRTDAGPGCRLQLDGSALPHNYSDPATRGLIGLTQYVNLFDPATANASCTKGYRLLPGTVAPSARIVYEGKGFVIVEDNSGTPNKPENRVPNPALSPD